MTSSPTSAVLPDARARDPFKFATKVRDPFPQPHEMATRIALTATPDTFPKDSYALAQWLDKALFTPVPADDDTTPPASDAAVPAGFVLVPVKPTQAMVDGACNAVCNHSADFIKQDVTTIWSAMLAAAPKVASDTSQEPEA